MKKTLIAHYKGHKIAVTNHWVKGCTLFVDDEKIEHTSKLAHPEKNDPIFSTNIKTVDGEEPLNIYVDASINIKLLIEVSGQTLAKVL